MIVVDQHILTSRLRLDVFDIVDQVLVKPQEFSMGIHFARNQTLANENIAGFNGIDRAVMYASTRIDDQSVNGNLFECDHLPAFSLPVRFGMRSRYKMCCQLLDPLRLNRGDVTRIDARGFSQFGSHYPFHPRRLLRDVLLIAARQLKFDAAGAEIVITFRTFHADVTDEAGEKGAVNVVVVSLGREERWHCLRKGGGRASSPAPPRLRG